MKKVMLVTTYRVINFLFQYILKKSYLPVEHKAQIIVCYNGNPNKPRKYPDLQTSKKIVSPPH